MFHSQSQRHTQIKPKKRSRGFTLIELLIVIAIIAILNAVVITTGAIPRILLKVRETRAKAELTQIYKATHMWVIANGGVAWPGDVNRGMPPGIEEYLGPGNWPDAPFNDVSEYDWDAFIGSDGKQVYQISIRFCPLGQPTQCKFPDATWAVGFDYSSSMYFCIEGKCRAHPSKPDNHPGYCVNCDN